jgi:hypothetical protein
MPLAAMSFWISASESDADNLPTSSTVLGGWADAGVQVSDARTKAPITTRLIIVDLLAVGALQNGRGLGEQLRRQSDRLDQRQAWGRTSSARAMCTSVVARG